MHLVRCGHDLRGAAYFTVSTNVGEPRTVRFARHGTRVTCDCPGHQGVACIHVLFVLELTLEWDSELDSSAPFMTEAIMRNVHRFVDVLQDPAMAVTPARLIHPPLLTTPPHIVVSRAPARSPVSLCWILQITVGSRWERRGATA